MPTGPKGEKRPADVIGNAVKVMRILTGEVPKDYGNVIAAIPRSGREIRSPNRRRFGDSRSSPSGAMK